MERWTFGFELETTYRKSRLKRFVEKYRKYYHDDVHRDMSGPYEINSKPFHWLQPIPVILALELEVPHCVSKDDISCGNHFHVKYNTIIWPDIYRRFWIHLYALNVIGYKFLAGGMDEFNKERIEWAGPTGGLLYNSKRTVLTINDCCGTLENRACEASPLRCYLLHWFAVALWEIGIRLHRYVTLDFLNRRWREILNEAKDRNAYLPPGSPLRTPHDIYRYAVRIYEYPEYRVAILPVPRLIKAVLYEGNPLSSYIDVEPLVPKLNTVLEENREVITVLS